MYSTYRYIQSASCSVGCQVEVLCSALLLLAVRFWNGRIANHHVAVTAANAAELDERMRLKKLSRVGSEKLK